MFHADGHGALQLNIRIAKHAHAKGRVAGFETYAFLNPDKARHLPVKDLPIGIQQF
jgi:hypothetical protein